MKNLIPISLLIFTFSCSRSKKNNETTYVNTIKKNDKDLANELISNEFFKYADTSNLDSLKNNLINSFDIYDESINRMIHVDAEEIAEFNFDFFIPNLNKILEKRKINLIVKNAVDYEKTNDIFINGNKINLYTKEDINQEIFWEKAPRSFFKQVNEILKSKNINEKFYLLYGGNDLHSILLTENQFDIIVEKYKNNKKEIPYLP